MQTRKPDLVVKGRRNSGLDIRKALCECRYGFRIDKGGKGYAGKCY